MFKKKKNEENDRKDYTVSCTFFYEGGCLFCTVENQGKGALENFLTTTDGKRNKKLPHNKLVFKS
jgi:hypothetical protein